MKKLPVLRLFAYVTVVVVLTTGLGFAVCLRTGNATAMFLVTLLALAIGMTLIMRWWIPVNRAMGVPLTKPTRRQWILASAIVASLIASVVIEHFIYELTANRFAEAIVGICILVPVGFFVVPEAYRRMRAVTVNELQISRLGYYVQLGAAAMFGLNLCLWLTERHVDRSVGALHEWNIAGYLALLTLSPFNIAAIRRRYLEAKALKDAEPPDRWQAYNNKLAQNE
jgi:hypothetical protein